MPLFGIISIIGTIYQCTNLPSERLFTRIINSFPKVEYDVLVIIFPRYNSLIMKRIKALFLNNSDIFNRILSRLIKCYLY